jgi:tetratricopeptide (TPR) repeat protein
MAWFDANHRGVLAAQEAAATAGWDTAVWQLSWTLDNFQYRRGHLHGNIASWQAGLAAAERLNDLAVQARAHRRLGLVYAPLGEQAQETALYHLDRSLTLTEKIGDHLGEAGVHFVLAMAWTLRADHQRALTHVTTARNLYRDLGDTKWESRALSMIGACHTHLGHHDEARDHCRSALDLCRQSGDVYGQADSLENLGTIAAGTGQHTEALRHYGQALTLWHVLDNTYRQAGCLTAAGDAHHALGHNEEACLAWQRAATLYRDQNLEMAAAPLDQRLAVTSVS